jgi:hypothetical protein
MNFAWQSTSDHLSLTARWGCWNPHRKLRKSAAPQGRPAGKEATMELKLRLNVLATAAAFIFLTAIAVGLI